MDLAGQTYIYYIQAAHFWLEEVGHDHMCALQNFLLRKFRHSGDFV